MSNMLSVQSRGRFAGRAAVVRRSTGVRAQSARPGEPFTFGGVPQGTHVVKVLGVLEGRVFSGSTSATFAPGIETDLGVIQLAARQHP